jgi:xanthine dehydrogenase YagR molybdenum-binding subunit
MISMNTRIGETPLDRPGGLLGRPLDRVDGPLKVTGHATYAYEYPQSAPTYAFVAIAGIATGWLTAIDTSAAERPRASS